jgi:hypothetical protein
MSADEKADIISQALARLANAARASLDRPGEAAARVVVPPGLLDFAILRAPAFAPRVSFAMLTLPRRQSTPLRRVCRVRWDSEKDIARLEAMPLAAVRLRPLEPSVEVTVLDAPFAAEQWLEEARAMRVPPAFESARTGADGESITVQFGELFHSSTYTWWCEGPLVWEPLVSWAKRIEGELEMLFRKRAAAGPDPEKHD